MISHAQNAEDVVLARALPGDTGFYVDVGAADPDIASVTRHFYDLGWTGINIDPRPDAVARLIDRRPLDINLAVAAGESDGEALLYLLEEDPDQSTLDPSTRESLIESGRGGDAVAVPIRTLDSILDEYEVGAIDFLKIDVEGAEDQVLRGIDLRRWQPTIIVIEAVRPWGRERVDAGWRALIEDAGYQEACFDGINLFFCRVDRPELLDALVPASVLDAYVPAGVALLRDEITVVRDYVGQLEAELANHVDSRVEIESYVRHLESVIADRAAADRVATSPDSAGDLGSAGGTEHGAPTLVIHDVVAGEDDARPVRPARLAIIGTPRTGNTWIRRVLADALGAVEVPVHHPGDLAWGELPERAVLQLHWPRTPALEESLAAEDFVVVSPARHPLDVLLSMLHFIQKDLSATNWLAGRTAGIAGLVGSGPGDEAFLAWAVGDEASELLQVTPDWWRTPSTIRVRYEDLVFDAVRGFTELLTATEQRPRLALQTALGVNTPARIHELSGGTHVWQARPGMWLEVLRPDDAAMLAEAHRQVFAELGYAHIVAVGR